MGIEVRRAGDRYTSAAQGRLTRHSFSFGPHYDPANLGFATMVAHNDEYLPAGTGYPDHPHADLEIVTWVLDGALRHTDAAGNSEILLPGDVQRISAGRGIVHAEVNAGQTPTRFLQTWLRPDESGTEPAYARTSCEEQPGLYDVIGPDGPLTVNVAGATLQMARGLTGTTPLPDAPLIHLFVIDGSIELGDRLLVAGDAARLQGEGQRNLVVPRSASFAAWSFRA